MRRMRTRMSRRTSRKTGETKRKGGSEAIIGTMYWRIGAEGYAPAYMERRFV